MQVSDWPELTVTLVFRNVRSGMKNGMALDIWGAELLATDPDLDGIGTNALIKGTI
jgi:hypothetical protein